MANGASSAATEVKQQAKQTLTRVEEEVSGKRSSFDTVTPVAAAAGDWNGDGKTDLVVANSGGLNVSILLGVGGGTFQMAVSLGAATAASAASAVSMNVKR